MNSSRPYLLRAFFEWIVDNDLTPYLVVDAEAQDVLVPKAYVEGGRIILNVSAIAVQNLLITNEHLEFSARFGGVPQEIYAPIRAISAIYAKENGRGMVFKDDEEEDGDYTPPPPKKHSGVILGHADKASKNGKPGKPNLTIVK